MVNLNIRVDEKLKSDAEAVLCRLGLSLSDAVRIFLSQIRNTQSIPFALKLYDEPTTAAVAAIKEAEKELKDGNLPSFTSVESLMTDLSKD